MKVLVFFIFFMMSLSAQAEVIGGETSEFFGFLAQQKSELASCVESKTGFYPVLKLRPVSVIEEDSIYYYVTYDISDTRNKISSSHRVIVPKILFHHDIDLLKKTLCSTLTNTVYGMLEKNRLKGQRQVLFIDEEMEINSMGGETRVRNDSDGNSNYDVWFLIPGNKADGEINEGVQPYYLKTKIGLGTSKINGEEKKYLSFVMSPVSINSSFRSDYLIGKTSTHGVTDLGKIETKIYLDERGAPQGSIDINVIKVNANWIFDVVENMDVIFKLGAGIGLSINSDGTLGPIGSLNLGLGAILFDRLQLMAGYQQVMNGYGANSFETAQEQDPSLTYPLKTSASFYTSANLNLGAGWGVYGQYSYGIVGADMRKNGSNQVSSVAKTRSSFTIGVKFTP